MDKILEIDIELWDVFLGQVGDLVDVVAQGDDLGTQRSLYISPRMMRKFVMPRLKKLYDFIHYRTKAKVFMHSCGFVYDAIPDLIEAGVEILNPIQRSAAKMDIATLKKEFGKELSFWGGGDLHDIGKNLVCMMLEGAGFEVKDLGIDVDAEKFIAQMREEKPQIVAFSAMLTTTMPYMKNFVDALQQSGARESVKIMVGGAPVTRHFADAIGADGYAADASQAVALARQLVAA